MTNRETAMRVVQCPKCGSPVDAAQPGEITRCAYCGSTLELSVGASGHPIARLANIEASTSYLAHAELHRRVREQLAEKDSELRNLRETFEQHREKAKRIQSSLTRSAAVMGGLLGGLILSGAIDGLSVCPAILLAGLVCWIAAKFWCDRQLAKLAQEHARAAIVISAERDRLAARVAELEAELDELSQRL